MRCRLVLKSKALTFSMANSLSWLISWMMLWLISLRWLWLISQRRSLWLISRRRRRLWLISHWKRFSPFRFPRYIFSLNDKLFRVRWPIRIFIHGILSRFVVVIIYCELFREIFLSMEVLISIILLFEAELYKNSRYANGEFFLKRYESYCLN